MKNKVKPEKYRKLSIASLVTGILTFGNVYLFITFGGPFVFPYLQNFIHSDIIGIFIVSFWLICLPIAAIVCGGIDLKRIKAGLYNSKGKGMNIAGIALGSVFILIATWFLVGEAIIPQ